MFSVAKMNTFALKLFLILNQKYCSYKIVYIKKAVWNQGKRGGQAKTIVQGQIKNRFAESARLVDRKRARLYGFEREEISRGCQIPNLGQ